MRAAQKEYKIGKKTKIDKFDSKYFFSLSFVRWDDDVNLGLEVVG